MDSSIWQSVKYQSLFKGSDNKTDYFSANREDTSQG